MNWIQTLQMVGRFVPSYCYCLELTPIWPHAASDLIIAIAGYVSAAALIAATRFRKGDAFRGILALWALGAGALGTLHLLEALSLRFVLDRTSNVVEGLAALSILLAAMGLILRLPELLADAELSASTDVTSPITDAASAEEDVVSESSTTAAIAPTNDQPLTTQVLTCTQELEKVQSDQSSLLQQEQNIRRELETALENLQDTAERLNIALSAACMGSWEWNLEKDKQDWSPQAKAILGFETSDTDLDYSAWAERVHPEDLPKVEAAVTQAQQNREIFSAEYRIQLPNQENRWVLSQGRFVFTLEDEPRRMIGVIQDVTQEKRASLAIEASEARFRGVFEQAAVGVTRLSTEGRWLQVNETFCQLLGYSAEEIIGKHFQDFTSPSDRAQDEHYYQQLIQGEVESCRFEKRYLNREGTPIWVMVTLSTEQDLSGNTVALIAVIEDIRQLKQIRTELEQRAGELEQVNSLLAITNAMLEKRNAELDQFAYVASHDLKAPLRAISNLSEWIEEDLGDQLPEDNQHQLSLLRNRVHRMEALINGLLEYSRVGRRERQIEEVDIRQMIEDAVDFVAPPESFTILLPEESSTIRTNRTALNQVFSNLISNAIKHHDRDDGTIQITSQDQGSLMEFAVIDDGPGIDPQYHDKVFTIFQTLKSRDELESTGIGLSLVKKIVESEGGSIRLESELGEGATFRFSWPKQ